MKTELFLAFLTVILDKIPGKKAFQKLVYFGQVLGIPLNHSYKMYFYGPYSESLAEDLKTAELHHAISKIGQYSYGPGEKSDSIIEEDLPQIMNNIDKIERLVELFGTMTPLELELYATVHFVDNYQKRLYQVTQKNTIIDVIKGVKGTKFTRKQIVDAYNQLEQWDLLINAV